MSIQPLNISSSLIELLAKLAFGEFPSLQSLTFQSVGHVQGTGEPNVQFFAPIVIVASIKTRISNQFISFLSFQ
jgi:hypothetical protein